ncbi:MAG: hypothetical protein J3Q66DRAFT_369632 [Benniella sp.]|nr:MAG: hypothetical protein J3Q66DRAFT_369632 [Benniella sp.]
MLRNKSSYPSSSSAHIKSTSSPSSSSPFSSSTLPARLNTLSGHYQHYHLPNLDPSSPPSLSASTITATAPTTPTTPSTPSANGVRRVFSNIQNALHPSRRPSTDEGLTDYVLVDSNNSSPSSSIIGALDKHSSSTAGSQNNNTSHPHRSTNHSNHGLNGAIGPDGAMTLFSTDDDTSSTTSHSLRSSRPHLLKTGSLPTHLGSFLHNTGALASTQTLQPSDPPNPSSIQVVKDAALHGSTVATISSPLQLRVRHLERGTLYSGYLTKFSSRTFFSRKQWKRRYFILQQTSLHCFKSSDPQHPLLESLKLCADTIICVTDIFSGKRYCLQITTPGEKNWYVLADTASEMSGWLRELKNTVLRFRGLALTPRPGTHYSDSSEMSDLSTSSAVMVEAPPIPGALIFPVTRSPSPPPRPPHPSHQLDLFQFSAAGNFNPPNPLQEQQGHADNTAMVSSSNSSAPSNAAASSLGQSPAEYASFGTIMEQADALLPEGGEDRFPTLTASGTHARRDRVSEHNDSRRNSTASGRRVSIVVDRPEAMIMLPRRNSQRLMGSPSRPMSPVSSRPMSPNLNRPSPRSSLVVAPPPRSIHRPTSIAISRHSTQVIPLQMANFGLRSGGSSLRSLSPTSDHSSEDSYSLSRSPSVRRLRESSIIDLSLAGSRERTYRSPSRPTIMTGLTRSMSPTPSLSSLSSAPTSPLPEPPRSDSPSRPSLKHTPSNGSSQRIPIVPRHHDPDQLAKRPASHTRSRSKSQELSLAVRENDAQSRAAAAAARANTPSPRLGAVSTKRMNGTPPTSPFHTPSKHNSLSLSGLVLPPPPTGQRPEPPIPGTGASAPIPACRPMSHIYHKHSLSNSSLRSFASATSPLSPAFPSGTGLVATYGGPVRKRSDGSTSSGSSHRESTSLSARLASLAPIPLESAVVSSPPTSALPPIPFPEPPTFAPPGIPTLAREQQQQQQEEEESGEDEAIPFPEPPTFSPHTLPTQTCEEEVPELCTEDKDNEEDEDDKLHVHSASFEMILEEEEDTDRESVDGNDILAAIEKTKTQKAIDIPLEELKLGDKEK